VKKPWAFVAPAASVLAGALMLAGAIQLAAGLATVAAAVFVAANILVVARQVAAHTALLLVAAIAWLAGDVLFATAGRPDAAVPWWFAFLVLTIAAERLEMARLMRGHRLSSQLLLAVVAAMLLGSAASACAATNPGGVEDDANYHFAVAAIGLRLMQIVDLSHVARARITASALWAAKALAQEM